MEGPGSRGRLCSCEESSFSQYAKRKVIGRERRLQWRPHHLPLGINQNGYTDPDLFWREKGEVRELREALECVPSVRGAFERVMDSLGL